jgi:hypothetical protein
MHEPLLIALDHLAVPCIFNSISPYSFIDRVDIFAPELVLLGFVVCLVTEGAHGDFRREDDLSPIHKNEAFLRCLDWVMSGYPIVRTEAHRSTFCRASSSHHKCES